MADENPEYIPDPSKDIAQEVAIEDLPNQYYFQYIRDSNRAPPIEDDDQNRALFHGENFKLAFNFNWMQPARWVDVANYAESGDYQILCLSVPLGPFFRVVRYTRLDETGRFNLPALRTYRVEIETDAEYVVIASPGDQWYFRCAYRRRDYLRAATISLITWPEEHFNGIIPIVGDKLHVLVKSGHFVSVVLLPSDDYGNRLIEDDFYTNETNEPNEANATLVRADDRVQIVIRDLDVVHHFKVEEKAPAGPILCATEFIFIRGAQ